MVHACVESRGISHAWSDALRSTGHRGSTSVHSGSTHPKAYVLGAGDILASHELHDTCMLQDMGATTCCMTTTQAALRCYVARHHHACCSGSTSLKACLGVGDILASRRSCMSVQDRSSGVLMTPAQAAH